MQISNSLPQWFFLTERGLDRERSHIAYGINYEFEDLLVTMTSGQLIAPRNSGAFVGARHVPKIGKGLGWAVSTFLGRFESVRVHSNSNGPRILFVTGMGSRSLRVLRAIRGWRKEFDLVVALVLDAFEHFPADVVSGLDHLFVIIPEMVEGLRKRLNIPVSFVPLACDVVHKGSANCDRSVDVLAYGRVWEAYVRELDDYFLDSHCSRLYMTSFSHPRAPDWRQQRKQFWGVLSRTKISIAFAPNETHSRFMGLPVISARWYEGLAAGCLMVGRKPASEKFGELFDWTDAAIQLPDSAREAPAFIEDLLEQPDRLRQAHARNYLMMLRRHDARLIFKSMCQTLGIDIPRRAHDEIEALELQIERMSRLARESGVVVSTAS